MGDNRVKPGVNDLASNAPELASQWDMEKNGDLTPDKVTRYSHRKVWWLCGIGHSWCASVNNRYQGQNCPICSGQKVLSGFNDLKTTNPELAKEWNYDKNECLLPTEVTAGSLKKVWWKCKHEHEWKAVIFSRKYGVGCPYCSGHLAIKGKNDLKTIKPDLIKEWDFEKNQRISPEQLTVYSGKTVWWKCLNGHSWKARVYSRSKGSGCPYCAGLKVCSGFNDLASKYPELVSEWDIEKNAPLKPEDVACMTHRHVWWLDAFGHSWKASIAERTAHRTGCPYCAGRKVLVGFNDLLSQNPKLADEWNYEKNGELLPQMIIAGSHQIVWWKCALGHEWQASPHNRQVTGCPVCAGQKVLAGYNDLATISPWLLESWDYDRNTNVSPSEISGFNERKVWWKCANGHHWCASVYSRQLGNGCPYCSGHMLSHRHLVS